MGTRSLALPVPALMIWDLLKGFDGDMYKDPPWAECLRLARGGDIIGELHLREVVQTDDFKQVPIARPLRVVMMRQGEGFIMRWANPGDLMKSILGGVFHDHLLRRGDQFEEVRSGYVTIPEAGYLEIPG
jgi:hypothetical protein